MTALHQRLLHRLCTALYYERTDVHGATGPHASGPTLYLPLHRNGAVDGLVLAPLLPRATFVVADQLVRTWFLRLFFAGIAVERGRDTGALRHNAAAVQHAIDVLVAGGDLVVFPEGTSSLEPGHLPFHPGAARIGAQALARGAVLRIVPIDLRYERAWAWRSRVRVVVGPAIATDLPAAASPRARTAELYARITAGLERLDRDRVTAAPADTRGARRAAETLGAPLVLAGLLANLPPLAVAWFAAHRHADDRNVVALWRILAGVPAFALWSGAATATLWAAGGWPAAAGYVALTVAAWLLSAPVLRAVRRLLP